MTEYGLLGFLSLVIDNLFDFPEHITNLYRKLNCSIFIHWI